MYGHNRKSIPISICHENVESAEDYDDNHAISELRLESQSIQKRRDEIMEGNITLTTLPSYFNRVRREFFVVGLYIVCNDYHSYETTLKIGLSTFN